MTDASIATPGPRSSLLAAGWLDSVEKWRELDAKMSAGRSVSGLADDARQHWKFLEVLCDGGNVTAACGHQAVKLPRVTLRRCRQEIKGFQTDWTAAMGLAADVLESEIFRRTLAGSDTVETKNRDGADRSPLVVGLRPAGVPEGAPPRKYGAPSGRRQDSRNVPGVIDDDD